MEENNAIFVFECLLRDNSLMSAIDTYILNNIFITKTFDAKNVPQLVLNIMLLMLSKSIKKNLRNDNDLQSLLDLFYTYIINKIKENPNLNEFNTDEFKKSYDICVRLAILKLKFKNKNSLCCIGK